ncbi:MAG: terminase large subunit [Aigarchaeota archaeon]|nr:terminase large subunit [Aigarchaeota archaeon]MCX8192402.1 terminase large subunit [Nitrososphaeria archaeon]MDW7986608.1 terminase large subunit [Nitrososphaerota archaeon]
MKVSELAQLLLDIADVGIKLYEWQKRWLDDDSRFRVMLKSRAVGGSFIIAIESIIWSLLKPSSITILLSYSHRQSMELFRKVKEQLSRFKNKKVKIEDELYSLDAVSKESRTEIIFKNLSRIICLPNNPDTIRGYRADHVYVDEAAMFKNDLEIKAAVIPIIAGRSGRLSLISTPKGRRGWFYEGWMSNIFSKHYVHYRDAPHLTSEDIEGLKKSMSHITWMQEMEMEFLDELNSLFPSELIISCLEDYPYSDSIEGGNWGPLYVGVDLGRYRDSTVIVAVEKKSEENMKVVFVKEFSGVDMVYQREYISRLIEATSPIRLVIDKTGLGIPIYDFLTEKYVNVEGLTLTSNMKEAVILNLYNYMKSGKLKIPVDCEVLIRQLHQFQRIQDKHGRIKYEASTGAHDDYVIALALAVYAATSPPSNIKIKEIWRW